MGGHSLNTKPTFLGLPKLISSWPLGSLYQSHIAVSVDEGRSSVSTAAICSGLTFTALYLAGIPDQARLCYGHHSNVFRLLGASNTVVLARLYQNLTRQPRLPTGVSSPAPNVIQVAGYAQCSTDILPLLMLYTSDCSADYVPPRMDLFSDDIAPLGFSSSPFCQIDSA